MSLRIGELFAGYGGLGMGVQAVLGGDVAWLSEIDPGACRILAHRFPGVPNLGDITAVDWTRVEPVDVLCGGFPCQDVSAAGKRLGLRPDTRSGLWSQFAYAIDRLRPPLVVIENVRGLLSADAHSDVEPCPWCVGDGGDGLLRALGAVLGDLAGLGFDAEWVGVRASDVGAPHGRFRVFIVAWPAADAGRLRGVSGRVAAPGEAQGGRALAVLGERRRVEAAAHAPGDGRNEGRPGPARQLRGPDAALGGHAAAHADEFGRRADLDDIRAGQPDADRGAASYADSDGREILERLEPRLGSRPDADRRGQVDWGPYGPAVHRWEHVLGRAAPSPTEPGRSGQPRLSPAFVEWLMGLPAGWVTDVPDLGRNEQLKALGNGVVPQQAAEALRLLLPDVRAAA